MSIVYTLCYLGLAVVFTIVGTVLFCYSTKMRERKEIVENQNVAAALMLGGKMVGMTIVIMSAAKYSVGLLDFSIWSAAGIVLQIVSYWVVEHLIFMKVSLVQKVEEGNIAVGVFLAAISIGVGMLVSGAISYWFCNR